MDADGLPELEMVPAAYIDSSRRLRDRQIGSGSTEQERRGWPLSVYRVAWTSFIACGVTDRAANVRESGASW